MNLPPLPNARCLCEACNIRFHEWMVAFWDRQAARATTFERREDCEDRAFEALHYVELLKRLAARKAAA